MASEEYYSATDDEDIPVFNIMSKIIDKKDDNIFFIKINFRELLAYSGCWCYNRTISQEKVDEIYKSLCENNYNVPFIMHAVYDEKYSNPVRKILILDGQHRREAIKIFIQNNDKDWTCDFHVWICVYKIDHSETHNTVRVIDIFKKINNNRVFNIDELPDTYIIDLVKAICNIPLFKRNKVIGMNISANTCHSPCIHKKELNNILTLNKNLIKTGGKTVEELVENIQKINHILSMKPYEDLYQLSQRNTEKLRYQRALAKGFFLNLKNSRYTSDVWIKHINNPYGI
jgi:hypothetical protein